MPGKLGLPEILVILAIALLIFGPSKLADLGKGLGEGIKNFKSAVKDGEQDRTRRPRHVQSVLSFSVPSSSDAPAASCTPAPPENPLR